MKVKIKKLISFLEENQLELESLVFNKGKLSFQVSENKFQESIIDKIYAKSGKSFIDDIDKYILPITQEQANKVIQTVFDGEKQVNIKDEKITDYKFSPLNFYGFRYNERGYFIKERKDNDKITSTFIMYPSNRESNSKTRWTFKRYNDKGIEITFYGDLTFKSYEEVEQFFFRNGVIKCD